MPKRTVEIKDDCVCLEIKHDENCEYCLYKGLYKKHQLTENELIEECIQCQKQ